MAGFDVFDVENRFGAYYVYTDYTKFRKTGHGTIYFEKMKGCVANVFSVDEVNMTKLIRDIHTYSIVHITVGDGGETYKIIPVPVSVSEKIDKINRMLELLPKSVISIDIDLSFDEAFYINDILRSKPFHLKIPDHFERVNISVFTGHADKIEDAKLVDDYMTHFFDNLPFSMKSFCYAGGCSYLPKLKNLPPNVEVVLILNGQKEKVLESVDIIPSLKIIACGDISGVHVPIWAYDPEIMKDYSCDEYIEYAGREEDEG